MTKYGLIFLIVFFTACNTKERQHGQLFSDKEDINEIVKLIVQKEYHINNEPLVSELHRIKALTLDYPENAPRPIGSFQLTRLLQIKINRKSFFEKTDSLDILSQNKLFNTFRIEKALLKGIKFISFNEVKKIISSETNNHFYSMTIPIFSANRKKAYVEWDYNCPLCGSRTALFLEKVQDRWVIVFEENLWVS